MHKYIKRLVKKLPKRTEIVEKSTTFLRGEWLNLLTFATLCCAGASIGYLWYENGVLSEENKRAQDRGAMYSFAYAHTNLALKKTEQELSVYKKNLQLTKAQRDTLTKELDRELEKTAKQEQEISTLEKLTTIDPELLQKYSKVFFLNENYAPKNLFPVADTYKYYEERDVEVYADVWPYLQGLLLGAKRDDVTLYILSAYRSFDTQSKLKSRYVVTYGAGTANQFSADQGYSEHQLGTALDFITTGLGGNLNGFEKTEAYTWMQEHAHEYGFTLSYPEKNGYYIFEPWHWRFVGIKLATDLHEQGKYFHDLTQRELDEYLVYIFD